MTKSINKQVEAQGVKKLDSFKGFQELNSKELREVEGDYIATGVGIEVR